MCTLCTSLLIEIKCPRKSCFTPITVLSPDIHNLVSKNNFRLACEVATALHVQEDFPISAFLVPLIVEDHTPTVEKCVQDSKSLVVSGD